MGNEVTVVIPCFNAAKYLREAIDSALQQTRPPAAVLVVDDGSSDDSVAVARRFGDPVKVIELGVNSGRCVVPKDAGLDAATTELVAFLDADDLWTADKLERQVPLFDRPEVGLVYGRARSFEDGQEPSGPEWPNGLPTGNVIADFYWRCYAPNSSVIARRSTLLDAGGFDRTLVFSEDYDLWLRAALRCQIDAVDQVVMLYRRHGGQISRKRIDQARMHIAVERRHEETVRHATGLSIAELRAGTTRRIMGQLESEFYNERNLPLARDLADLILELFPDLDSETREQVVRIRRRASWPQALFKLRDLFASP